jgi:hypothetical protein
MQHSNIVGGSTAKRVIACPGSVALVDTMPPKPSSSYADEGTLLHDTIASILERDVDPYSMVGTTYADSVLTEALVDDKLVPALRALDEVDPTGEMEYAVESRVGFGDFLPDVFGSTDLLGRLGDRAIVLDWKFGDGVAVEATENAQLLFYAAAARRTPETAWAFQRCQRSRTDHCAAALRQALGDRPCPRRCVREDSLPLPSRLRSGQTRRWRQATIASGARPSLSALS